MSTRQDDPQFRDLCNWYAGEAHPDDVRQPKDIRWLVYYIIGLCLIAMMLMVAGRAQAGGAVTDSKYVLLQRSGVTQTPNPTSITECLARMAEMIDAELKSRTTGYVTYKCLDISQSYAKFAKAAPVANRAPSISGTPASTATVGQAYSFTPTASDPDGDALTFVLDNRPPWATFDTATGKLSGTPTASDIGVRSEIRIRVSDGKGGEATLAFGKLTTVAAVAATSSVTLSWTPPTQNTDGTALTNLSNYLILYGNSSSLSPDLIGTKSISVPAGVSSYVVDDLAHGIYYFAVRAVNTAGVESVNSNIASKSLP